MLLRGTSCLAVRCAKRFAAKYVLAIETADGLKRAEFVDLASHTELSHRPGVFAEGRCKHKLYL